MAEPEHYQKLLIPVNIVVVLLCLTAVLSLLFAPLISIDMTDAQDAVLEFVGADSDRGSEGGETSESGTQEETAVLASGFTGISVSLSTFQLAKFAFSGDPTETLIDGIVGMISSTVERVAIGVTVNSLKEELGEEFELDKEKINSDALFTKLEAIGSAENADAAISAFSDELRSQLGADVVTDEYKAEIDSYVRDLYDNTLEHADTFSVEAAVCILLSEAQTDDPAEYTTSYRDMLKKMLGGSQNEETAPLSENIQKVADIASYLVYAMFAFMAIWFILAVFAFVHIFTENKRCAMWYVKAFGFFPCLIFGVAPLVAGGLLSGLGGIGALISAIRSLTWISGGCYVALWLVSIFWAHPIKKKLKEAEGD